MESLYSGLALAVVLLYYGFMRANHARYVRWFGYDAWHWDVLSWFWPVTVPILYFIKKHRQKRL